MKIFDLNEKYLTPIAIALGFFDCIHIGHKRLIERAIFCAKSSENSAEESALLTFCNDPNTIFNKLPQIYSFDDRISVLNNLCIDNVISAKFDDNFVNIEPIAFLDKLFGNFNVKCVIVGSDYTFGKSAKGDVKLLKEYCERVGATIIVQPFENVDGVKLATSSLKSLVVNGQIDELNKLLSFSYFINGKVISERREGKELGFPTANINYPNNKLPLRDGIYATITEIDGIEYHSMTNVGDKPTFNDQSKSIETHIFDFDKDIYGKTITVHFIQRIRDIIKFASLDALKKQLHEDRILIEDILHYHR